MTALTASTRRCTARASRRARGAAALRRETAPRPRRCCRRRRARTDRAARLDRARALVSAAYSSAAHDQGVDAELVQTWVARPASASSTLPNLRTSRNSTSSLASSKPSARCVWMSGATRPVFPASARPRGWRLRSVVCCREQHICSAPQPLPRRQRVPVPNKPPPSVPSALMGRGAGAGRGRAWREAERSLHPAQPGRRRSEAGWAGRPPHLPTHQGARALPRKTKEPRTTSSTAAAPGHDDRLGEELHGTPSRAPRPTAARGRAAPGHRSASARG